MISLHDHHTVILISGKQGSGKTTLAKGLTKALLDAGYCLSTMKFATPLYKMEKAIREILKADGMDTKVIHKMSGSYVGEFEGTDGPLLQLLGTEWGRKTRGENFWVDYAKASVKTSLARIMEVNERLEPHPVYIFDDCRFPNELMAFSDAITIRLEAPEEARHGRAEKWRENTEHPSETALDEAIFDLVLHTDVSDKAATLARAFEHVKIRIEKKRVLNGSLTPLVPQPQPA